MLTAWTASNLTTVYICKYFASLYLETRDVKKRLSCTRELIGDLQRKLEKFGEDVNASIQGIETKFLQLEICASTGNSVLENLKQETARAGEILEDVQERTKMILGKSFELEDIALDKMIERRARAQEVKSGLADRTKEDDGQKNGESQTREAATMDREKIQLLCDGKLILHKIVSHVTSTPRRSSKGNNWNWTMNESLGFIPVTGCVFLFETVTSPSCSRHPGGGEAWGL